MNNELYEKFLNGEFDKKTEQGSAGHVDADGFWIPRGETLVPVSPKPPRREWDPFDDLFTPGRRR
jgi:hypothetical protein